MNFNGCAQSLCRNDIGKRKLFRREFHNTISGCNGYDRFTVKMVFRKFYWVVCFEITCSVWVIQYSENGAAASLCER